VLKDRRLVVERAATDFRRKGLLVPVYAAFLRTLFGLGDWFVTITFRDRHKASEIKSRWTSRAMRRGSCATIKRNQVWNRQIVKCAPDPLLASWEPDSRYGANPGPPVRDVALREIRHWLYELGWEASGHSRQEIFNVLANGLEGRERRAFAKSVCRKCLYCEGMKDAVTLSFFLLMERVATQEIGWVIAEELGKTGGRWHVHLLIRGAQHLRRKKWWWRAFVRFGRSKIEPIHE
jgi:hypothetical protein